MYEKNETQLEDVDLDSVKQKPLIYRKNKYDRRFVILTDPRLYEDGISLPKKVFLYIYLGFKLFGSMFGSVLLWVAMWDMLERDKNITMWTEIVIIGAGTVLFVLLTLIYKIPFIKMLTEAHKPGIFFKIIGWIFRFFRDGVAVFLSIAIWKSGYNMFEYYLWEDSYYRASLYCGCGFMAMLGTNTLIDNTSI